MEALVPPWSLLFRRSINFQMLVRLVTCLPGNQENGGKAWPCLSLLPFYQKALNRLYFSTLQTPASAFYVKKKPLQGHGALSV